MKGLDVGMKTNVEANFIYSLVYNVFTILVPLITTPFVSRRLGAVGIGDYAYAYSIANYYVLFIKLGLNNYGNRTVAFVRDDKAELAKTFWNIYCFQFILAIVFTIAYIAYSLLIADNRQISILLVLFVISAGIDITWFYWGLEEFKKTVTRDFIIKVISTACIFLFIRTEADTWKYTLILSSSFFASQLMLWPTLGKYVGFVKPTWPEIIRHIKPNLLLFLPAVAVSFYKIMDKIMLGMISSREEVGLYESSEKILRVPMAIIEALGVVMQPRMSNLVSKQAEESYMSDVLKKSIILTMFFSTMIGFGIMTVSEDFVPVFYGTGFEKCSVLFRVLLPSCMFLAFTNVFKSQYLLPRKKDKEYIVALFTGAGVNLVVNLLLIPHHASVGAAIGTLLAEASVCCIIGFMVYREIRFSEYLILCTPFLFAGIAMFLVSEPLFFASLGTIPGLLLKIVISAGVYFVLLTIVLLIDYRFFGKKVTNLLIDAIRSFLKRKTKPA